MSDPSKDSASEASKEALKDTLKDTNEPQYILQLYVTGNTARSSQAIENIQKVCQEYLDGRYELEVIDIFQQPARAKEAQIIAAPTLIRQLPRPLRKLVGDMADEKKLLVGLGISLKDIAK
jgi:circadian clock protein KaiB